MGSVGLLSTAKAFASKLQRLVVCEKVAIKADILTLCSFISFNKQRPAPRHGARSAFISRSASGFEICFWFRDLLISKSAFQFEIR
jgi:hypothetical protein